MRRFQTVVFLAAIAVAGCEYYRNFQKTIERDGCVFKVQGSSLEEAVYDKSSDFQAKITFPDGSTTMVYAPDSQGQIMHMAEHRIKKWLKQHPTPCRPTTGTTIGTTTGTTATGTSTPRPVNDGFD